MGSAPAVTPTLQGLVAGDGVGDLGPLTCTADVQRTTPVGAYADKTNCSGVSDPNYRVTYTAGDVTVTPAPVVVTAGPTSSIWGTTPGLPSPSYSGFRNGQTASVLTQRPDCSVGVTAMTNAGSHVGATSCRGAAAANYAFTYATGTATVTKAALVVTPVAVRARRGDKLRFSARLSHATTGDLLAGVRVTFEAKVGGVEVRCRAVSTMGDGMARCTSNKRVPTSGRLPAAYSLTIAATGNTQEATARGS